MRWWSTFQTEILTTLVPVLAMTLHCGPGVEPFLNPSLPVEQRVDDLVSRMTLEEKVSQLTNDALAIERLGIPHYNWWGECLHGVARAGRATVFPQAIALAATWDQENMHRIATIISDEARAKHHEFVRRNKRDIYQGLTFWSPNINIFRDPRWGRGMETYGEDPFLTGQMAVQFIKGLQGDHPHYFKTIATAKHYAVHSGPEPLRHTFNAKIRERDLRQTYLPQFEAAIKQGKVYSIMCAYNRYDDEACCGSNLLLTQILRQEWGFEGYVVSDCGAIRDIHQNHQIVETAEEASSLAVKAGCDLNCGVEFFYLLEAVRQGLIREEEIDVSVKRLFRARFLLGMFDPPEMVPFTQIPYEVVDSLQHREQALETARKSIVLLKNEKNLLPLSKNLKRIAVIGPNADDLDVLLGNYNGDPGEPVTLLEGIRKKVTANTQVLYAFGCRLAEEMPDFEVIPPSALFTSEGPDREHGLIGQYYASADFNGEIHRMRESSYPTSGELVPSPKQVSTSVFTRVDKNIDFNWLDRSPREDLDDDDFGVRWKGFLVPPISGKYALGVKGFNAFDLYLDGDKLLSYNNIHHPNYEHREVDLVAGRTYAIQLDYFEILNDSSIQLLWSLPARAAKQEAEALRIARQADVVILALGLSPRLEGEEMRVPVRGFAGGDRLTLDLPPIQYRLMEKIHALGKPVVLVLFNGSAVSINWAAENLPAIVEAWYPGQAGGDAVADVLFGDYNPAGRLPVTFYKSLDQLPPFEDYRMEGRTYRYFNGDPLFPFGYGLSYTSFGYQKIEAPMQIKAGESITISAEVTNTGRTAGEEVVQLYVSDLEASVPVPVRSLGGFQRLFLNPGETAKVEFILEPSQLAVIDDESRRIVEPGWFEVSIGGKQPGFSGLADAASTGTVTTRFEVVP